MKIKNLLNPTKQIILFFSLIGIVVVSAFITIGIVKAYRFIENPVPAYAIAEVNAKRETQTQEILTMKEWVLKTVAEAGLNPDKAENIIQCESSWDNWKYNVNTNGSTDFGLWQINSIHKNTASVECRWDYKCSTYWAIQKRLNDGNWEAWVCN